MRLAFDIGLAGFALGVERVEGEVEIMFGRFAGVDRAALRLRRVRLRGRSSARSLDPRDRETETDGEERAGADLAAAWAATRPGAARGAGARRLPPARGRCFDAAGSGAAAADGAGSPPRRPKKRGPFQLVPVIFRAMVERLA